MREPDKPLPGDVVIRCREERLPIFKRTATVWIITHWPDTETVLSGPHQSYRYALEQAHRMVRDRSEFVWRDHARPGEAEQLELVGVGQREPS